MKRGGERWFLHELTRELGGHTAAELGEVMGSREFTAWIGMYRDSPWGDYRDDLRAGVVAASVYNAHRTKGRAARPGDYVLEWHTTRRPDSAGDMYRKMKAFSALYNAEHRRRGAQVANGHRRPPAAPIPRRLE